MLGELPPEWRDVVDPEKYSDSGMHDTRDPLTAKHYYLADL